MRTRVNVLLLIYSEGQRTRVLSSDVLCIQVYTQNVYSRLFAIRKHRTITGKRRRRGGGIATWIVFRGIYFVISF